MIVSGQFPPSVMSLTHATTGTEQLSVSSVTTLISGAGAAPPATEISAGFDAVGGVVSSTVIV